MRLFDSIGPNPRVVRMAAAEKGLVIDRVTIDIMAGENRQSDYSARVPTGGTPALELDDGQIISEILAIAEYFEDIQPAPPIIGSTPAQRAESRMWTRRIDLGYCEPMANGFRATQGRPMFKSRMTVVSEDAAAQLKAIAAEKLLWLDGLMVARDSGDFICGNRFTLADMLLFGFVEFGDQVGQPMPAAARWLPAWRERVAARPSAAA